MIAVLPLSFIQSLMRSGTLGTIGFILLLFAAVLFLVWVFFVSTRCRPYWPLCANCVVIAVIGYIAYDWRHVSLTLRMRDAQRVRDDCIELIQRRATSSEEEYRDLHLKPGQLPASFVRLGAKDATVAENYVLINFINDGWRSQWGFLYDPNRPKIGKLIRPTCYPDFYEYVVRGE